MFPKIVVLPKSSILIGFSIINHAFWDTTIFGNTQMAYVSPLSTLRHMGVAAILQSIEALKYYHLAIQCNPRFAQTLNNLGTAPGSCGKKSQDVPNSTLNNHFWMDGFNWMMNHQIFTLGNGWMFGVPGWSWWVVSSHIFCAHPENWRNGLKPSSRKFWWSDERSQDDVFSVPKWGGFLNPRLFKITGYCKTTLLQTNISQPRPALLSRWIFLFLLGGIWTCSLEGTFKGELPSFGGSPLRGIGFTFWGRDESELSLKRYINTVRPWLFRWYTGVYTTQLPVVYEVD